jgi:hypothetical protein
MPNNEVNVDVGIAIKNINIIDTSSPAILGGLCSYCYPPLVLYTDNLASQKAKAHL